MSFKTGIAKYVPHFGPTRVAPEPAPTQAKQKPAKVSTQSILGNLAKKFSSSRNGQAEGKVTQAPVRQYQMGASARTRQEMGGSTGRPRKTSVNEGLPPELNARFQALRGGPVPSEKELFARFDALKTPIANKPAAQVPAPEKDLKTLMQELKKAPGPILSATAKQTGKTDTPIGKGRTTAKPAQASPPPARMQGGRSGTSQLPSKGRVQNGAVSSGPRTSSAPSAPAKSSLGLNMDDFQGLADIKRRPSNSTKQASSLGLNMDDFKGLADINRRPSNVPKQAARVHSTSGGGAPDRPSKPVDSKPLEHFEKWEADRAENANERPSKAAAKAQYEAQFFSSPQASRPGAKSKNTSAYLGGAGNVSGQPIRPIEEFMAEEADRAAYENEHPSDALAWGKYNAQFAPKPAVSRRQNTTRRNESVRTAPTNSSPVKKSYEQPILPLSHFEKQEADDAAQMHRHTNRGAALEEYLRQFE